MYKKILFPIYPYLISKEDEIVRPCDRHSNETVTLREHAIKYKNMRKLMVVYLKKFENRGIKQTRFLLQNTSIYSYLH